MVFTIPYGSSTALFALQPLPLSPYQTSLFDLTQVPLKFSEVMGPHTRIRSRSKHDSYSFVFNKAMENERVVGSDKALSDEEKAIEDESSLGFQKAAEYKEKAVEDDRAMEHQDKIPTYANNMIGSYTKACFLLKFNLFVALIIVVSLPCTFYLLLTNVILKYTLLSDFISPILEFDGTILPKFNTGFLRVKNFCDGLPESTQCYKTLMVHNLTAAFIIFAIGLAYLLTGLKVANKILRHGIILQGRLDLYEGRLNTGLKLEARRNDEAEYDSHFGNAKAIDL